MTLTHSDYNERYRYITFPVICKKKSFARFCECFLLGFVKVQLWYFEFEHNQYNCYQISEIWLNFIIWSFVCQRRYSVTKVPNLSSSSDKS